MRYPVSLEPAGTAGAAAAATDSALGTKPAGSALGSVHRRALDMSIVAAGNRPVRAATWSRIHGSCWNSIRPGQTVWPVWRWPAMFGNVRCSPKIEMYSSALSGSTWWSDAFQDTSWMRLASAAEVGLPFVKSPMRTMPQLPALTPSAWAPTTPKPPPSSPSWRSPGA